ncbi:YhdP family protein [Guyparkeria sp.]|uniref:YhdP family phospholipid transporter n=1 Tax=Guyparkeria sp. TaxID=2035736 RepID=UPI0035613D10
MRRLLMAVAFLLVFVAVLSGMSRALLPWAERYQPDLEAMVSAQLDAPVRFGTVDLRWQGYQPQVVFRDVTVGSGPRLEALSLGLSWRRSLVERRLVADKITLDGARFTLIQNEEGGWSIADLALEPGRQAEDQPVTWAEVEQQVSRLGHLSLRDAEVEFQAPDGRRDTLVFSVAAEMERDGWRASGVAELPGVSDESLRFSGEGRFGRDMDVRLFLEVADWRLKEVQKRLDRYGGPTIRRTLGGCPAQVDPGYCEVGMPRVDSGRLDGQLWLEWGESRLQDVTIRADIAELAVTRENLLDQSDRQAKVSRVSTRLAWRREEQGWRLNAEDIDVRPTEGGRLPTDFVRMLSQGERLSFATNHADLEHLAVWLAAAPLPTDFLDLLDQNVPRGQARDVRLAFDGGRLVEGFLELENFGNTTGVPLRPVVGTASGEAGVDLTLYRQPAGWLAEIEQRDVILAIPGLFREPIWLDYVSGHLYSFDEHGVGLYSPDLELSSRGLDLGGRFFFREATGERDGYLGIDTGFSLADTRRAPAYLPRHLIGPGALDWLDRALEGEGATGQVSEGRFIFHGDPARAPFHEGGGHFSVVFDFDGLTLPFREAWPALSEASGNIAFINRQFHASIDEGQVARADVGGSRVSIFELEAPRLEVALDRRLPLDDLLWSLGRTPIMREDALAGISATGEGRFDLDIGLGLYRDAPPPSITGGFVFDGNRVGLGNGRFTLDDLAGRLAFDGPRLSSDDIRGLFLGRPFNARVAPRDSEMPATRVTAETRLTPDGLRELLGGEEGPAIAEFLPQHLEGGSGVSVRVDVPHAREPVEIRAESNLIGLGGRLPAPLAKDKEAAWPLVVDLALDGGRLRTLSGRIDGDERWRFDLGFDDGQLARSLISNRDGEVSLTGGAPHQVHLDLDLLRLDPWMDIDTMPSGGTGDGGLQVDARIGRLGLGDWQLRDVAMDWSARGEGWRLAVAGEENRGQVTLAGRTEASAGRLTGALERLRLHHLDSDEGSDHRDPSPLSAWDLSALPRVELEVGALTLGDRAMGQFRLGAHVQGGEYLLDRVDWLPNPDLSVSGSGRIVNGVSEAPQGQQTRLMLTAKSRDLGAAIASITGNSPLSGGQIEEGNLSLSWPGSPASFSLARAIGHSQFLVTEGEISQIAPGAGRLVGLMSLGALADRLRFDFRDVTREGLFFETLTGRLRLDQGRLNVDALELVNPSLTALIDGRMELIESRLDLTARIYADYGMLLPLIGTVAGGPLVGGAILALQQTFKQLDQAPEPDVTYHIGGSLDEPIVTSVKAE